LRLVPSDPLGRRYHLEFEFDASAPAAATVFFGAAEDPRRRCALRAATVGVEAGDEGNGGRNSRLLASKVAAIYPKGGMGLCFPPPSPPPPPPPTTTVEEEEEEEAERKERYRLVVEGCSIAAETAAALAADSERAMTSHQASSSPSSSSASAAAAAAAAAPPFAVAVRLEALTPEAEKEASGGLELLRNLVPGAPHSAGTQSQTTFARILPARRRKPPPPPAAQHQGGEGGGGEGGGQGGGGGEASMSPPELPSYEVRVVKQKIWVAGVSYELQEIYGMDAAASAAAEAAGRRGAKGAAANAAAPSSSSSPSDQTAMATETEAATASASDATAATISSSNLEEERLCVVCLCEPRDTTVLPCRHM